METRQQVYYWKGVIDPNNNINDNGLKNGVIEGVLTRLLAGEYQSLNLERLRGHDVFSVRVNDANRMLFTTKRVDGVPHILVLDVVLNHDYDKSRFLKPAVLRNFLVRTEDSLNHRPVSEKDFEKEEKAPDDFPRGYDYDLKEAEYFQHQFIEFNVNQHEAAVATLPLAISGSAGSGKSCVAMSLIANHAKLFLDKPLEQPILYVAKSEALCRSMERDWQSTPLAQYFSAGQIQFVAYDKLVQNIDPAVSLKFTSHQNIPHNAESVVREVVGFERFCEFMQARIAHQRNIDKNPRAKSKSKKHAVALVIRESFYEKMDMHYQEFRAISGCPTIDVYRELGADQTLLPKETKEDIHEREWLYVQYPLYLAYLDERELVDISFYRPAVKPSYELIVVDETQDLSHIQISLLSQLATQRRICFCEDARQSLAEILAKETYFSRVLPGIQCISLKGSYRCPNPVVKMANVAVELVSLTTGHKQPVIAGTDNNNGNVRLIENLTQEFETECRELAKSPEFAVITLKEHVKEAIEKFGTQLVMTVEEIKGFQYRHVLIYRLFDDAIFYQANAVLDKKRRRPVDEKFGPAFNAFYTACTRSMETLTIVQPGDNHKISHILELIKRGLPSEKLVADKRSSRAAAATEQDWLLQIRMHLDKGHEDLAENIATKSLSWELDQYRKFRNDYLQVAAPTVIPASVTVVNEAKGKIKNKNNKKYKHKKLLKVKLANQVTKERLREQLIANPTEALLKLLFAQKFVGPCLFEELPEGTTLFNILCSNDTIRNIFLTHYFPEHFDSLYPHFTNLAFMGKFGKVSNNNDLIPGIYWLALNNKCIVGIAKSPLFISFIDSYFSTQALIFQNMNNFGLSALFSLSCHDDGINVLHHIFSVRPGATECVTEEMLFAQPMENPTRASTTLFQNLLFGGGRPGIEIFTIIQKRLKMSSVMLENLFPRHGGGGLPLLCDVLSTQAGRSCVSLLQKNNPTLTPMALVELDHFVLLELERNSHRELGFIDSEVESFKSLINFPSVENLIKILINRDLAKELFIKKGHECLFVKMFDDPDMRNIMITAILRTAGGVVKEFITADALFRNHPSETEIPPLLWLVGNEKLAMIVCRWLANNTELLNALDSDALTQTLSTVDYMRAKLDKDASALYAGEYQPVIRTDSFVSILSLLTLSVTGRMLATHRLMRKQATDALSLSDRNLVRSKDKVKVNLFEMLMQDPQGGHDLLFVIFRDLISNGFDIDLIWEKLSHNIDNFDDEVVRELSSSQSGIDILHLMTAGKKIAFANVASTLLAIFTPSRTLQESTYQLSEAIYKSTHAVRLYLNLVKSNPVLVENFNRALFDDDMSRLTEDELRIVIPLINCELGREFRAEVAKLLLPFYVEEPTCAPNEFNDVCLLARSGDENVFAQRYPLSPLYMNVVQFKRNFVCDPVLMTFKDKTPIEQLAQEGEHAAVQLILNRYINPNQVVDYNDGIVLSLIMHIVKGYIAAGHEEANYYIKFILPNLNAENSDLFYQMLYVAYMAKGDLKKVKSMPKMGVDDYAKIFAYSLGLNGELDGINKLSISKRKAANFITYLAYGLSKCQTLPDEQVKDVVNDLLMLGADVEKVAQGYMAVGRNEFAMGLHLHHGLAIEELFHWACVANDAVFLHEVLGLANEQQTRVLLSSSFLRLIPKIAMDYVASLQSISLKILAIGYLHANYLALGMFREMAVLQIRYPDIVGLHFDVTHSVSAGWLSYFADSIAPLSHAAKARFVATALVDRTEMTVQVDDLTFLAHIDNYEIRDMFALQICHNKEAVEAPVKADILTVSAGVINHIMHTFKIPYGEAHQLWITKQPFKWLNYCELFRDGRLNLRVLLAVNESLLVWLLQGSKCFSGNQQLFMLITQQLTGLSVQEIKGLHEVFSKRIYGRRHLTMFQVPEEASSDVPVCVPARHCEDRF